MHGLKHSGACADAGHLQQNARVSHFRLRALVLAWMFAVLAVAPPGVAVPPAVADATAEHAAGIDERLALISRLRDSVASLPEWDRDGILFRVDEEVLALHRDLKKQAEQVIAEGREVQRVGEQVPVLWQRLNDALALSADRVAEIGQRIERELADYDQFSQSPETIISRAFVQDLRSVRLRHLTALLDGFKLKEDAGLPQIDSAREVLGEQLELASQRLIGQIRLDAMTLQELRGQIAADPADESVRVAARAVERKHAGNLDALAGLINLRSRAEHDVSELRALQVQQRGLIGSDVLDSAVFARLLADRLDSFREQLILTAPKWTLRLLAFSCVLILAFLLAHGARSLARRVTLHRSVELGDLRERTIVSLTYAIVLLVGFVIALSALGVSLLPLMAGLGVVSIVVGFALQESLGNLAAGGLILLTRPFDLHDRIRIGDAEGKVKNMSLVATTVASRDNTMLVIPNRQIWNSTIVNYTRPRVRRVDVEAAVPCDADLGRAESILRAAITAEERVLEKPEATVELGEFGESAVTFWVRVWVETSDLDAVSAALKRDIAERLRDEGIDSGIQVS